MITRRQFATGLTLGAVSGALSAQTSTVPSCLNKLFGGRIDVDIHCHIFNGSDLQVERFIVCVAAGELNSKLKKALEKLARPLQRAVWKRAPRGEKELGRLERFGSGDNLRSLGEEKFRSMMEEDRREGENAYSEGFAEQLRSPDGREFLKAYDEYVHSVAAEDPAVAEALAKRELATELERLANPDALLRQLETERRLSETTLQSLFGFTYNFFQYRYVNAFHMLKTYGCDRGTVQLIAAAMVDYDFGLGVGKSPTPTSLPVQFKVMTRIAEVFDGRVLPYLPFDPWRLVLEGPALFDLMKNTLAHGEAVGVKLYPPMGFAPLGNKDLLRAPPSWPPVKDFGAKLDGAMTAFWDFATQLDVPVIAHGGRSNAAAPDYISLGNPDKWAEVLKKYPEARVCFGHFGGQELLKSTHKWPQEFLKLAAEHPNAYGDFSYYEDVLSRVKEPALRNRVAAFMGTAKSAEEHAVYGSDWMMLAREGKADRYFERFAALLGDKRFKAGVADNILSRNAIRFLGLGTKQITRQRLETFYKAKNVSALWRKSIP